MRHFMKVLLVSTVLAGVCSAWARIVGPDDPAYAELTKGYSDLRKVEVTELGGRYDVSYNGEVEKTVYADTLKSTAAPNKNAGNGAGAGGDAGGAGGSGSPKYTLGGGTIAVIPTTTPGVGTIVTMANPTAQLTTTAASALGFDTTFGPESLVSGAGWGTLSDYNQPHTYKNGSVAVTDAQQTTLANTYGVVVDSTSGKLSASPNSSLGNATIAYVNNVNAATQAQTNYNNLQTAANTAIEKVAIANAKVESLKNQVDSLTAKVQDGQSGYWSSGNSDKLEGLKKQLVTAQTEAKSLNETAMKALGQANEAKTNWQTAQNKVNESAQALQTQMQSNLENYVNTKTTWGDGLKDAAKTGGNLVDGIGNDFKGAITSDFTVPAAQGNMWNDPDAAKNYYQGLLDGKNTPNDVRIAAKVALDRLKEINGDAELKQLVNGSKAVGNSSSDGAGAAGVVSPVTASPTATIDFNGESWSFSRNPDGTFNVMNGGEQLGSNMSADDVRSRFKEGTEGYNQLDRFLNGEDPAPGSTQPPSVDHSGDNGSGELDGVGKDAPPDPDEPGSVTEGSVIDPLRVVIQVLTALDAEDDLTVEENLNIKAGEAAESVGSLGDTALAVQNLTSQIDGLTTLSNTTVGAATSSQSLLASATVDMNLLDENVSGAEFDTPQKKADEIKRRRGELLKQYTLAAVRMAEGMNAISSRFPDRASILIGAINKVGTESAAYGVVQDAGRYVLLETLRGLALSSAQMGVQASRLLYDQEVEVQNAQNGQN